MTGLIASLQPNGFSGRRSRRGRRLWMVAAAMAAVLVLAGTLIVGTERADAQSNTTLVSNPGGAPDLVAVAAFATALHADAQTPQGNNPNRGSMLNLQVSSDAPGEFTLSWDMPDPEPNDYRFV